MRARLPWRASVLGLVTQLHPVANSAPVGMAVVELAVGDGVHLVDDVVENVATAHEFTRARMKVPLNTPASSPPDSPLIVGETRDDPLNFPHGTFDFLLSAGSIQGHGRSELDPVSPPAVVFAQEVQDILNIPSQYIDKKMIEQVEDLRDRIALHLGDIRPDPTSPRRVPTLARFLPTPELAMQLPWLTRVRSFLQRVKLIRLKPPQQTA